MKKIIANKGALKPSPRVLVSCRWNGEDNALAVGYCGNCSFAPPMVMVGIVPSRYSYEMIKNAKNFVVNLPVQANKEMFNYLGSVSKRDEDKLKKYKTTEAEMIDAPMLADCPVNIECEIVDSIETGSHVMFVGKILKVHAEESVLTNDKIDMKKIDLIIE